MPFVHTGDVACMVDFSTRELRGCEDLGEELGGVGEANHSDGAEQETPEEAGHDASIM